MALNSSASDSLDYFGPADPNRFDFTPLFEDVFLSALPSCILLLSIPFRLFMLRNQPRKVSKSFLHSNKLVSG